jgi:hypothetical protein
VQFGQKLRPPVEMTHAVPREDDESRDKQCASYVARRSFGLLGLLVRVGGNGPPTMAPMQPQKKMHPPAANNVNKSQAIASASIDHRV